MLNENDFRKRADTALESLKQSLITAEESADFEVEDQSGALHISFEDGSRFVISPNAPVRQYGFRRWPQASSWIGRMQSRTLFYRRPGKS